MDDNTQDDFFGVCPTCKQNDGYLNVGRDHYFICHEHRVKWCRGSNLFSSWKSETEDDWVRNRDLLSEYKDVEAFFTKAEISNVSSSEANHDVHPEPCCLEQIPASVRRAVAEVIECFWDEELHHFVECARHDTAANVDGSLFAMLCELRTYFEGRKHDPRFYLAKAADPEPVTAETRFVIDRVRNVVFEAQSQEYVGEVLQTTVGRLRDETGNVIGLEVMHSCKGPDGEEFCIDSSVMY